MDLQGDLVQREDVKLIADKFLGQLIGGDDGFTHVQTFWRTLSPSFKPAGGLTMISSPPIKPCSTRTVAPLTAPVLTTRRTALPSSSTNTAPSLMAEDGTIRTGLDAAPVTAGFSSEMKATLAFISGRRYSSGFTILTLIWTVAFWRLASGEISLM